MTPPQGRANYVNVINIHMEAYVPIAAYLQEIPRPFWIVGMVLGFVWFWPVGLLALAYLVSTRRGRRWGTWYNMQGQPGQPAGNGGTGSAWGWGPGGSFGGWGCGSKAQPSSSNRAFDDYRAETLRRLEEEQKEFMEYLERLRQARDKQEFDQFMADRRRMTPGTDAPQAS